MAVAGPTWATDEVFTLTSDLGIASSEVVESVEGTSMTLTFDQGANSSNAPKYYSTGDAVRLYGGNTLTITPTAESTIYITKVVFERGSGDSGKALIASTGKMTGDTWEGCSNGGNITFTADGTTGHVRIAKVTVTYNTDGCPEPTVETTEFMPTFSPEPSEVEAGTAVTITANDEWIISSYLLDLPDETAIEVNGKTATVTLTESCTITVYGYNTLDESTAATEAQYTVAEEKPEATFVLTAAKQGYENAQDVASVTSDNGEMTLSFSSGKYYTTGDAVRVYGDGTMTVAPATGTAATITKIVITRGSGDNGSKPFSANIGDMDGDTWTGEAGSVTFTAASGNGHIRVQTVDVTYTVGEAPPVVTTEFNPTFSPEPGEVDKNTEVTITANDEWDLYFYTLNGDQYVFDNNVQSATVTITEDSELIVCGRNTLDPSLDSNVVTVNYTVNPDSPDYVTVTLPYEESLVSDQGKFVVEGDACWNFNSYGAVASKKNVTSWLVSPLVDAEDVTEAITLTFEHQGRFFTTPSEEATLWVREAGGDWEQLAIEYPEAFTGTKWTTFSEVTVDLSDYAGKTFQIGYQYTSTETSYGGWEIKNVSIVAGEPVVKEDANLSYDVENFTATIGEENDFPALNNPNDLDVTYRSTNTSVATIDEEGNVELQAAGQTTIIAEFAGDEAYNEGSASYLLVVKEQVIAGTDKYELVTDVRTLAAEDEIIIVGTADEENFFAMSTTQNANNRAANAVEIEDDGTIIPGSDIQIFTLEEGELGFAFYTGSGYIYAANSSSNWLRTEAEADDNAYATIDIDDENGEATIVFQGSNTRNHMRFNTNNGNPVFACYAESSSIKNMPRIYRKVTEEEFTYDVTLSKYGLGTFYWSDKAFLLPEGLSAATYTYDAATKKVRPNVTYAAGSSIPADEAVVLKGEASATYTLTEAKKAESEKDADNRLKGLDEEGSVEIPTAVFKYYWLGAKDGVPGFYYGAANGAPFTLGAHKAFLALSENEAAEAVGFELFDVNAINALENTENGTNDAIYNLNGQKVNKQYKGVVIINGKKQIRK